MQILRPAIFSNNIDESARSAAHSRETVQMSRCTVSVKFRIEDIFEYTYEEAQPNGRERCGSKLMVGRRKRPVFI